MKTIPLVLTGALVLAAGGALWAGPRWIQESDPNPQLPKPAVMGDAERRGPDFHQPHLAGLRGVHVRVEEPSLYQNRGMLIRMGREEMEKKAIERLLGAGIPVFNQRQQCTARGQPELVISVGTLVKPAHFTGKTITTLIAYVRAELRETVRLERDPATMVLGAAIWSETRMCLFSEAEMHDEIAEIIDLFCRDYWRANPKK